MTDDGDTPPTRLRPGVPIEFSLAPYQFSTANQSQQYSSRYSAAAALLVDDIELNCEGARELEIRSVWFRTTE